VTLTYRLSKGAPLTFEEIDGNFKQLEEKIEGLQQRDLSLFPSLPSIKFSDFLSLLRAQEEGGDMAFSPCSLILLEDFRQKSVLAFFSGAQWYELPLTPLTFEL